MPTQYWLIDWLIDWLQILFHRQEKDNILLEKDYSNLEKVSTCLVCFDVYSKLRALIVFLPMDLIDFLQYMFSIKHHMVQAEVDKCLSTDPKHPACVKDVRKKCKLQVTNFGAECVYCIKGQVSGCGLTFEVSNIDCKYLLDRISLFLDCMEYSGISCSTSHTTKLSELLGWSFCFVPE